MDAGTVKVYLNLDDKQYKAGMLGAEKDAQRFQRTFSNYATQTATASKRLGVGLLGLGTAFAGVISYTAKITGGLESSRQGFVTLLGSAKKADDIMRKIKKEASRTPFEIAGLTSAVQLMSSVTKDGDKALDFILDIGEGLSAMGKGQAELDRISVNLQQIGAIGRANMLDIKQFAFAGIPIFEMLKSQTGLAGDALDKFITDGGVTFELLQKMFDKATKKGGRFFEAYKNQAGTFNQLTSNMKDNFNILLSDLLVDTGAFDAIKNALKKLNDWVTENKDQIKEFFKNTLGWLKDNGKTIAGMLVGALTPAVIALAGGFALLMLRLAPFMLLGALFANFDKIKQWFDKLNIVAQVLITTIGILCTVLTVNFVIALAKARVAMALTGGTAGVGGLTSKLVIFGNTLKGLSLAGTGALALFGAFAIVTVGKVLNSFQKMNETIQRTKEALSANEYSNQQALKSANASWKAGRITTDQYKKILFNAYASGGRNIQGGWSLVGERGAELVRLPQGSDVFNHQDTKDMLSGGGSNSSYNTAFNAPITINDRSDAYGIMKILGRNQELANKGFNV